MTDSPSAVPAVIDYLVTLAATVDDVVYDGPPSTNANEKSFTAIGWDGDTDNLYATFARIEQEWAEIGALAKNEIGHIECAVVRRTGDKLPKIPRDLAFTGVSAFEAALRAALRTDATLQALVLWIGVTSGELEQGQTDNGVRARVSFTVDYMARI